MKVKKIYNKCIPPLTHRQRQFVWQTLLQNHNQCVVVSKKYLRLIILTLFLVHFHVEKTTYSICPTDPAFQLVVLLACWLFKGVKQSTWLFSQYCCGWLIVGCLMGLSKALGPRLLCQPWLAVDCWLFKGVESEALVSAKTTLPTVVPRQSRLDGC